MPTWLLNMKKTITPILLTILICGWRLEQLIDLIRIELWYAYSIDRRYKGES